MDDDVVGVSYCCTLLTNYKLFCKIWGSHSGVNNDTSLPEYDWLTQ